MLTILIPHDYTSIAAAVAHIGNATDVVIEIEPSYKFAGSTLFHLDDPLLNLTITSEDGKESARPVFNRVSSAVPALEVSGDFSSLIISNIKFKNCPQGAIRIHSTSPGAKVALSHTRFVNCGKALNIQGTSDAPLGQVSLKWQHFLLGSQAAYVDHADLVLMEEIFAVHHGTETVPTAAIFIGPHVRLFKLFEATVFGTWGTAVATKASQNAVARTILDVATVSLLHIRSHTAVSSPPLLGGGGKTVLEKSYVLMAGLKPTAHKGNPPPVGTIANVLVGAGRELQVSKCYSQYRRPGAARDADFVYLEQPLSAVRSSINETWQANIYVAHILPPDRVKEEFVGASADDDASSMAELKPVKRYMFPQTKPTSGMHKRLNDARGQMMGVIKNDAYKSVNELKVSAHRQRALTELWKEQGGLKTPIYDSMK